MGDVQANDFPILCETCLGENPFVRMTRERHGKACKICERPFTVFRWRPGPRARYKKTELCPTCAKIKNVCQTCVLDLQFGLPVQVRDSALEEHERSQMPESRVGRGVLYEQMERELEQNGGDGGSGTGPSSQVLPYGKLAANRMLQKLQRREPYYKRNLPHICSFFVKGECSRGDDCPYRHEQPVTGELAKQNIRDRFHGDNDPVANKMMNRFHGRDDGDSKFETPEPPQDVTITTLFVGGIDPTMGEDLLRQSFSPYGLLSQVTVVPAKKCAFVAYCQRADAEKAMQALHGSLYVNGVRLHVNWGRGKKTNAYPAPPGMDVPQYTRPVVSHQDQNKYLASMPPPPAPPSFVPPPGMSSSTQYPSTNPNANAARFTQQ